MSPERRKYLRRRAKQHKVDNQHAELIERLGVVEYSMDLPSLEKAVAGEKRGVLWLTTGFDWLDKPHRVVYSSLDEVRALRKFIAENFPIV